MREPLTARQNETYEFIRDRLERDGRAPSVHEIQAALNVRSTNSVAKHVNALIRKGYLTREPHLARSLALADDPSGGGSPTLPLIRGPRSEAPHLLRKRPVRDLVVDPALRGGAPARECLVMRLDDDAMAPDSVFTGDLVVVHEAEPESLQRGRLVAAVVGRHTLARRLFHTDGGVLLRAAEPRYHDILVRPNSADAFIVGRITAVLRSLEA